MLLPIEGQHDVVVFDLDDTLYPELEYVDSGLRAVAHVLTEHGLADCTTELQTWYRQGRPPFDDLVASRTVPLSVAEMLQIYRAHPPSIAFNPGAPALLRGLQSHGARVGVITDGRSVTQRNKLGALGLTEHLAALAISEETGYEKPHPHNFQLMQNLLPARRYTYIADNLHKDFQAPHALGWRCICLRTGATAIHPQPAALIAESSHVAFIDGLDCLDVVSR